MEWIKTIKLKKDKEKVKTEQNKITKKQRWG